MRNRLLLIWSLLSAQAVVAQKAWVTPALINPDDSITIWVDLGKCDCQRLTGSSGPLYFYTWLPALLDDTARNYNGPWELSNEALRMTRLSGNIWYFKMVPTRFYGVSAVTVYEKDLAFRVKKKDGTGIGTGCDQDATEALSIALDPPPPVTRRIYPFPSLSGKDSLSTGPGDMLSVFYNNKLETKDSLKGKTDFYLYLEATGSNGGTYRISTYGLHGSNPKLAMKNLGNGLFCLSFIPTDYFNGLIPAGVKITALHCRVTRKIIRNGNDAVDEIAVWQLPNQCD